MNGVKNRMNCPSRNKRTLYSVAHRRETLARAHRPSQPRQKKNQEEKYWLVTQYRTSTQKKTSTLLIDVTLARSAAHTQSSTSFAPERQRIAPPHGDSCCVVWCALFPHRIEVKSSNVLACLNIVLHKCVRIRRCWHHPRVFIPTPVHWLAGIYQECHNI